MSGITFDKLDEIEKAASAAREALGDAWLATWWFEEYFGENMSRYLATMDPTTTLALVARVRELEADHVILRDADRDATGRFAHSEHLTPRWHTHIRRLMRSRDAVAKELLETQADLGEERRRARKLEQRVRELEAQVARVRKLHERNDDDDESTWCDECEAWNTGGIDWKPWPCDTIKALGEEA